MKITKGQRSQITCPMAMAEPGLEPRQASLCCSRATWHLAFLSSVTYSVSLKGKDPKKPSIVCFFWFFEEKL